jgi:predicted deacylase
VTGAQDGPALTVIAGVHGCEYAPMAAVRQWATGLAARELRGTVRAVPVLNMPSFRARSPFVVPEDGKNLNRCFPGNPTGTLAERLAHAALTELITSADAVIDTHAGDLPEVLEPFAMYDAGPNEARALELAEAYGLGYVIRQQPGPDRAVAGTTSTAAAELGIPAIIAEAGGCGIIDDHAVWLHLRGLDRVLTALGMTDEPAPGGEVTPPVRLIRMLWLRSAGDGWWQPAVRPGQMVAQGELLGTVSTIDGARIVQSVTAPADGALMFITTSPAVEADGLLLGLGAP